ncbi:helix-turn-helix domain-containing protein [Halovivax cerinus]|uniref:Helix-turn-helix domain-containing protein n=1 Tax=Halovivax cerinus TaxID=1487865 RepID=A0ABD5NKY5_9EURY|nr:helix-turn-helix domain-containing protein [Halovivax cerinus]
MDPAPLRFVTLSLSPEEWLGKTDEYVFEDPDLAHGPVYDVRLLPDGSVVTLYEVRGPPERIEALLRTHEPRDVAVAPSHDGAGAFVYAHGTHHETVAALLRGVRALGLAIDRPIEFRPDGSIRVTLVGDEERVRGLFERVPESVSMEVERTGAYEPSPNRVYASLTDRQREILRAAVELGYYRQPRETSYEEIAERLGTSEANVGEHIRRIESKIVAAVVP